MPGSDEAAPAPCQVIKADAGNCIREKGAVECKDLVDAFHACAKTLSEGS